MKAPLLLALPDPGECRPQSWLGPMSKLIDSIRDVHQNVSWKLGLLMGGQN